MASHDQVLDKVIKKIRPNQSEEKKLTDLAKKTLEISIEVAKKHNAKTILAGSLTRKTWLPGKKEFDIFILFPTSLPEDKLEEHGLAVGREVVKRLKGKFSVEYAQHPYASGLVNGIDIDIVPCYEVTSAENIKSAVDRTPFHVRYIEKSLPVKLSDDVRLLKQFLTVNNLYGADSKTQGFSGYVCELLVINYGGFTKVLKDAVNWVPSQVVDIQRFYKEDDYHNLRKKFKNETLILIDPTDKNRNTSSALSSENFLRFKKIAKEFLKRPDAKYFSEQKTKPIKSGELNKLLSQRNTEFIVVKFKPPKLVPDILYPQLRKFTERLQNILEETKYEFKVLRRDVYTDEKNTAVVLLEMEISSLPSIQKRIGPSIFDHNDSMRFLGKYKNPINGPFVEDGKWVVEIKREFTKAHEKIIDSLKNNSKILKAKGIPNYVSDQLPKGFEVICDKRKIIKLLKDKRLGVFLKNYFFKEPL
ncbi:MAG: CCA tRNA nucleotidyltransferase [Candidatus Aenigmarchaeota archaeon]|nr:CCA tRNA nucleotidyltransferase [Candidatus Aenigmarchaeota archaeon]